MNTEAELAKWLNLCRKAGALAPGAEAARAAVKSGKAFLLLTASDAGRIARELENLPRAHGAPLAAVDMDMDKNALGPLTGRRTTAVAAITNRDLALKIQEILKI